MNKLSSCLLKSSKLPVKLMPKKYMNSSIKKYDNKTSIINFIPCNIGGGFKPSYKFKIYSHNRI